jgi:formylglycine-generating enzyme required for sulfatase activity
MLGMLDREPLLDETELEAGDVLLCAGTTPLQLAISALDMSWYSHAALWTSDGVIECVPSVPGAGQAGGVVVRSLAQSIALGRRRHVAVMRWQSAASQRPSLVPVVDQALSYQGRPYALSDVMLMAFLILRNFPVWTKKQWAELRPKMPEMLAELRRAEGIDARSGMTCSELVATSFYEAVPRHRYALRLRVPQGEAVRFSAGIPSAALPGTLEAELDELVSLSRRLLARREAPRAQGEPAEVYRGEVIAGRDWALHNVTPKDLRQSPTLVFRGRLRILLAASGGKKIAIGAPASEPTNPEPPPAPASPPSRIAEPPAAPPIVAEVGWALGRSRAQRLLYVAASRRDKEPIDSDGEYRAIVLSFERCRFRKQLGLCTATLGAFFGDIHNAIDREHPTMLHFAGHGGEAGLEVSDRELGLDDVRAALGSYAPRVKLVVLNACDTAELARGIAGHVQCAIGMAGRIKDADAKLFAETLYLALGNGRSVRDAFQVACRVVSDPNLPVLVSHTDAGRMFIVPARRRWILAAVAAALGLAVAFGALRLGARDEVAVRPQAAPVARIAGGVLRAGSSEAEARAAYADCVALEGQMAGERCGEVFEGSMFSRELERGGEIAIHDFRIDRVEVTNAQFAAWLQANHASLQFETDPDRLAGLKLPGPAVMQDGELLTLVGLGGQPADPALGIQHSAHGYRALPGREAQPVRMITWLGARRYCTSRGARLPTSHEWEWAARGPARRRYPWGNAAPDCGAVVFGRRPKQPCESPTAAPEPVGTSHDVTPEGVYDLGGNVSEWVETALVPDSDFKLIRGGNFQDSLPLLGAARLFRAHRIELYRQLGFRCAQSVL